MLEKRGKAFATEEFTPASLASTYNTACLESQGTDMKTLISLGCNTQK
jgi:hypothetical protein